MIPLPNEFVRPPFAYTLSGHRDGLSFTANDRRALYRPHWVALEGLDGQRLQERYAAPATFRGHMKATAWDDLQLAHYCGRSGSSPHLNQRQRQYFRSRQVSAGR